MFTLHCVTPSSWSFICMHIIMLHFNCLGLNVQKYQYYNNGFIVGYFNDVFTWYNHVKLQITHWVSQWIILSIILHRRTSPVFAFLSRYCHKMLTLLFTVLWKTIMSPYCEILPEYCNNIVHRIVNFHNTVNTTK